MLTKIILGTANFTQDYGILANKKLKFQDIVKILENAVAYRIKSLDTAFGYGSIFQDNLKKLLRGFTINTKFSLLDDLQNVFDNLKNISSYNIDVLMVHDPQHLSKINNKDLLNFFIRLREEGIIRRIGVSVYDQEEVKEFSSTLCKPDVIQLPLNPLNQTFNNKSFVGYTQENNIEVHARSLFLQGILLTKEIPSKFSPIKEKIEQLMKKLNTYPSRLSGLLTWADQQKWVNKWILGVSTVSDLNEIITETNCTLKKPTIDFKSSYHPLLDPRTW